MCILVVPNHLFPPHCFYPCLFTRESLCAPLPHCSITVFFVCVISFKIHVTPFKRVVDWCKKAKHKQAHKHEFRLNELLCLHWETENKKHSIWRRGYIPFGTCVWEVNWCEIDMNRQSVMELNTQNRNSWHWIQ